MIFLHVKKMDWKLKNATSFTLEGVRIYFALNVLSVCLSVAVDKVRSVSVALGVGGEGSSNRWSIK